MSTNEYVPSEAEMMIAWHRHATAEDAKHGRLRDDSEGTTKEFVRYMARVRRDAAREALDGLIADKAHMAALLHAENGGNVEDVLTHYRDTLHPEEIP